MHSNAFKCFRAQVFHEKERHLLHLQNEFTPENRITLSSEAFVNECRNGFWYIYQFTLVCLSVCQYPFEGRIERTHLIEFKLFSDTNTCDTL